MASREEVSANIIIQEFGFGFSFRLFRIIRSMRDVAKKMMASSVMKSIALLGSMLLNSGASHLQAPKNELFSRLPCGCVVRKSH